MEKIKKILPTKRRLIQLYSALLYNAYVKGFIKGEIYTGGLKVLCAPGLNCYSCPGAVGACPLGALQNGLASTKTHAPTYILGILLLYGLIFGRTICGFICPFGLIQDLLHKIPTPKLKKSAFTRKLSLLKYVLLLVFVVVLPLWYARELLPVPAFCKYICPAGTLEGAVALLAHPRNSFLYPALGKLFTLKSLILVALIFACVFIYRVFCRFLCPLGAIYSLFSKVNVIGVKLETSKCIDCGKCHAVCGMDIHHVGDRECIHCGECVDSCPTKAISFKAGSITLHRNETEPPEKKKKTAAIIWSGAMFLLVLLLVAVNIM